jgi:aspartyl/asparaginyl-tRNA synthetase
MLTMDGIMPTLRKIKSTKRYCIDTLVCATNNRKLRTMKQLSIKDEQTDFLLYTAPEGKVKVEVFLNNETVWLTQKAIAALFGVQVPAISKHLKNIFESGELQEDSVISILETTAEDGKVYQVHYYNLDAIISVGYRVNSRQATQFRIWATNTLKEYLRWSNLHLV